MSGINNPPNNATFIAAPTDAGIRSAISQASAAGGGTVLIPSGNITILSPITLVSGVNIIGVSPVVTTTGDDLGWTITGGTNLVGDGTFSCFVANNTTLGAPANPSNFYTGALRDMLLKFVGFTNFTHGVETGATNNPGPAFCQFEDLYFAGCTDFAFKCINPTVCEFMRLRGSTNAHAMLVGSYVAATTYESGNCVIFDPIFFGGSAAAMNNRGLVLEAGGVASAWLNQMTVMRGQFYTFNRSTISQAATMANLSSNIGVTDSTKFQVGAKVTVSATVNGFTKDQTYVVLTSAANVITLGNSLASSAISATGNAAVNIVFEGAPHVEVIGSTSGSQVTFSKLNGLDLEGPATCQVYIENGQGTQLDFQLVDASAQTHSQVCARNHPNGQVNCFSANLVSDLDASSTSWLGQGLRSKNLQSSIYGQWYDATRATPVVDLNGNVVLAPGTGLPNSYEITINGTPVLDYAVTNAGQWTTPATINVGTVGNPITNLQAIITYQSLTGAATTSAWGIISTWNTTGGAVLLDLSVTDTASNANSSLILGTVNGTDIYQVRKDGFVISKSGSGTTSNSAAIFDSAGAGILAINSSGAIWLTGSANWFTTIDTGISRGGAGVVAFGNGSNADASATIKAKTKAGAPTTSDVPSGTWALIRDTTNNTTKIYYNNAGTLQSVALA